jgi:hypothetical protein
VALPTLRRATSLDPAAEPACTRYNAAAHPPAAGRHASTTALPDTLALTSVGASGDVVHGPPALDIETITWLDGGLRPANPFERIVPLSAIAQETCRTLGRVDFRVVTASPSLDSAAMRDETLRAFAVCGRYDV